MMRKLLICTLMAAFLLVPAPAARATTAANAAHSAAYAGSIPVRVAYCQWYALPKGRQLAVYAWVYVIDAAGKPVSRATVTGWWQYPLGVTSNQSAVTDSEGKVRLGVTGPRGEYRINFTNISKAGYYFDTSGLLGCANAY